MVYQKNGLKFNHITFGLSNNEYLNHKLCGKNPIIKLFEVTDKNLYEKQDDVFKGIKILSASN